MSSDINSLTDKLEKVSRIYTKEFAIKRDDDWFILKLQEELGELIQSYLMMTGQARKKGLNDKQIRHIFEGEVADVLSHVLILARHFGVDMNKAVEDKWLKWDKENT
jgi:NTP pyrophosphatase (non-canonical NTP hydrolase)